MRRHGRPERPGTRPASTAPARPAPGNAMTSTTPVKWRAPRVLIPPCFRVLQRYWRPQLAPGDPYRPGLVARAWPGSLASRGENRALAEVAWPRITAT